MIGLGSDKKQKVFFNIFFQQAFTDGLCQHHHKEDFHPHRRARHHGRRTGETQSNPRTYFVPFSSDFHSFLQVNMANLKDGMQRWLRDHNIKGYYSCTQVIERKSNCGFGSLTHSTDPRLCGRFQGVHDSGRSWQAEPQHGADGLQEQLEAGLGGTPPVHGRHVLRLRPPSLLCHPEVQGGPWLLISGGEWKYATYKTFIQI